MTIIEQKKNLRKEMLLMRLKLDVLEKEKYDRRICDSLWEIISAKTFKTVHCYLPMGTEINIMPLIEKMLSKNITVLTPKTLPKSKLENRILKSLNEVEKGVFGTSHPSNAEEFSGQYDLIIVPGLAFNDALFRLGYGGGYYDTFLAQFPLAYKIGIFYPFQRVEDIPLEAHDLKLDAVLVF